MDIKEEHDEAVILRPALKQKKRDETTNTEECVNDIKEEHNETVKNNTEECVNDIKEEQHEADMLRPALKKQKRYETTKGRNKKMRGKMNVELLVSLVSEHKELYDKRDSDYKNLDKREMLWSVIAEQMGLYGSVVTILEFLTSIRYLEKYRYSIPFSIPGREKNCHNIKGVNYYNFFW